MMNPRDLVDKLPRGYSAGQMPDGKIVIFTNEWYSDGDGIVLFLEEKGNNTYVLTDAGETRSQLFIRYGEEPNLKIIKKLIDEKSLGDVQIKPDEICITFYGLENLKGAALSLTNVVKAVEGYYTAYVTLVRGKWHVLCSKCYHSEEVSFDKLEELGKYGCERCGGKVLLMLFYKDKNGRQVAQIFAGTGDFWDAIREIRRMEKQ